MTFLTILWWLLVAHAFTDYVFQTSEMVYLKKPGTGRSNDKAGPWWWWMVAHGLINGAGVGLVTGSTLLAVCETVHHALTDYGKCRGWLNVTWDQTSHLFVKVLYAGALTYGR